MKITENFTYIGTQQNFERDSYATLAEMKAVADKRMPDIFTATCKETGKLYIYNKNNEVDETLGKWREVGIDGDDYVTKVYVDTEIAKKADTDHTHTTVNGHTVESDVPVDAKFTDTIYDDTDIKAEIAKKADITSIPSKISELTNDSNYQTAEQVSSTVTSEIAKVIADAPEDFDTLKEMSDWIAGHENDASAMNSAISDNKTAITALQSGKADKSEIPTTVSELTDSADYAKKTDIPSLDGYAKSEGIPTKVSQLENDSNYLSSVPTEYITETELDAKGYLTEHQDLSSYAKKDDIANTAIVHELTESEYNNLSESEQNNGDFYHIIDKNAVSNNSWEKGEFEYICDIFTDVVRSELLISKDFISVSIYLRGGVWDSYEWLTLARTGIPRSSSCGLIALVTKSNDTIVDKSYPVYAVYEKDGRINIINTNPAMPISEIQLHATIPRI